MAARKRTLDTDGDSRKKTPEEIAEERIEAVRKSKATERHLARAPATYLHADVCQAGLPVEIEAGAFSPLARVRTEGGACAKSTVR